jgi:RND family efflux transporter MFP subunit
MRTAESHLRLAVALALLGSTACGRKEVQLPPASGAGAPPLPTLPKLEKGKAGDKGVAVAPTEGRTTGTTFPRAEAQVGPNAGGVIARIAVKEGDRVRKGALLFRQDTRDAALRLEQAKAARAAAEVQVRAVETEHRRMQSMFEQKAATQSQWDEIQARLDGARVALKQAAVGVSMASKMLADGTVHSPIDGVITAKLKSEGEMATMMPPTVVLVVQDQSVLELRFRLPEKALAQVKIGDAVSANFEAMGVTREAKVARIQQTVDARSRTVEVVAEIPNKDGTLKSGLLATVDLDRDDNGSGPGAKTP